MSEFSAEQLKRRRLIYFLAVVITIIAGITSRVLHTGILVFDKHLGDALYAVLFYLLLRTIFPKQSFHTHAIIAMALTIAVELFQITGVPAAFRVSENSILKLASIALGTQFAILDIVAYAVGVFMVWIADTMWSHKIESRVR